MSLNKASLLVLLTLQLFFILGTRCSQKFDLKFGDSVLDSPQSIALDPKTRTLFVSDRNNDQILIWDNADSITPSSGPSRILCKPSLNSPTQPTSRAACQRPGGIWLDDYGTLWLADFYNSRILWWRDAASVSSGANATGVIGQSDFTSVNPGITQQKLSNPQGVMVYNDTLWVSDSGNYRVLRFDGATLPSFPTKNAKANGVIGADSYTTLPTITPPTAQTLGKPAYQLAADSYGLYVPAEFDQRVVFFPWEEALKEFGATASFVIGQANFTSVKNAETNRYDFYPEGVFSSNGKIYVADASNYRVLTFSAPPNQNYPPALDVFGPKDFVTYPNPDYISPYSSIVDTQTDKLWVVATGSNCVVRYPYASQVPLNSSSSRMDVNFENRTPFFSVSPKGDSMLKISLKGTKIEEISNLNGSAIQTIEIPDFGYSISTNETNSGTKVLLQTPLNTGTGSEPDVTQLIFSFLLFENDATVETAGTSFFVPSSSLKSDFVLQNFHFLEPDNSLRFHFEISVSPSSVIPSNSTSAEDDVTSVFFEIQNDASVLGAQIDFIGSGVMDGSANRNVSISLQSGGQEGVYDLAIDIPTFTSSFSYDPVVYFRYKDVSSASRMLPFLDLLSFLS